MKRKNLFISVALLTIVMTWAGLSPAAGKPAEASKSDKLLLKISDDGNMAMRAVRFARVEIFNGQPEAAEKRLDQAKKGLEAAEKQAPELTAILAKQADESKKTAKEMSDLIPIDVSLTLSDDFVATPEKSAKIKEANEHLRKGEHAKAIEILRQADIGIVFSRVLMPLHATIKRVDSGIALLKDHKYYEANLALKSAEDGLIVDTVMVNEPIMPKKTKPQEKKK
jgi:hypothetical protein